MKIGFSADSVTLAGAPLQNLRGDLVSDGAGFTFESAQFRAPGFTDVTFSGKAGLAQSGFSFTGPADVASADPRLLLRWLDGRDDPVPDGPAKAVRLRADIAFGADKIALERLKAEVDRKTVDGRLVYLWPTEKRKARLDAELTAAELDVDSVLDFAQAALGSAKLERPGEVSLALDIGRATIAGIEARKVNAKLTFDPAGLTVERLSLGEFGGASLNASGRISTAASAPRGSLGIDLDARDLTGLSALLAKFAPAALAPARRMIERMGATKLRATLDVEDAPEKGRSTARFALNGQSGGLRIALKSDATGDHASIMQATARIDASIETDDSAPMFRLIGLDRAANAAKGPGRFSINAQGPLDGPIKLDSRVDGGEPRCARARHDAAVARRRRQRAIRSCRHQCRSRLDAPAVGGARAIERGAHVASSRMNGRQFKFENAMASVAGTQLRGNIRSRSRGRCAARHRSRSTPTRSMPPPFSRAFPACRRARADASWPAEPFAAGLLGGAVRQDHGQPQRRRMSPLTV